MCDKEVAGGGHVSHQSQIDSTLISQSSHINSAWTSQRLQISFASITHRFHDDATTLSHRLHTEFATISQLCHIKFNDVHNNFTSISHQNPNRFHNTFYIECTWLHNDFTSFPRGARDLDLASDDHPNHHHHHPEGPWETIFLALERRSEIARHAKEIYRQTVPQTPWETVFLRPGRDASEINLRYFSLETAWSQPKFKKSLCSTCQVSLCLPREFVYYSWGSGKFPKSSDSCMI